MIQFKDYFNICHNYHCAGTKGLCLTSAFAFYVRCSVPWFASPKEVQWLQPYSSSCPTILNLSHLLSQQSSATSPCLFRYSQILACCPRTPSLAPSLAPHSVPEIVSLSPRPRFSSQMCFLHTFFSTTGLPHPVPFPSSSHLRPINLSRHSLKAQAFPSSSTSGSLPLLWAPMILAHHPTISWGTDEPESLCTNPALRATR